MHPPDFPRVLRSITAVTTEKPSHMLPLEIRFYEFIICETIEYNANPYGEQQKYLTSGNMRRPSLHRKVFVAACPPVLLLFRLYQASPEPVCPPFTGGGNESISRLIDIPVEVAGKKRYIETFSHELLFVFILILGGLPHYQCHRFRKKLRISKTSFLILHDSVKIFFCIFTAETCTTR